MKTEDSQLLSLILPQCHYTAQRKKSVLSALSHKVQCDETELWQMKSTKYHVSVVFLRDPF